MRVKLWGTRGSVANPSTTTSQYGGNTPCVEVRGTAGEVIILDAGIGLHWLGQRLMGEGFASGGEAHVLLSHLHWDHIQGIPFFTPLLIEGNHIRIYGRTGNSRGLRDSLLCQMERAYCPVPNFFDDSIGALLTVHELETESISIGGVHVRTRQIHHGDTDMCLGYRIENDGGTLAYLPDIDYTATEHQDAALDLAEGADLLIHDAHHTADEDLSDGHSSDADAVRIGEMAGVGRVMLFHHHPDRSDDEIDAIVASHADRRVPVSAAAQGDEIRLSS
ncbi:MAG: MBL fold metallo-hydrolase [Candidatus Latescibacteria bacterium]|nr:MBL fold metallo-hydrolase [Candidatus Latescibacterota bacterium]